MENAKLRIALFQNTIKWEDKQSNYKRLERVLRESAQQGIDCVFMPEMSFTGFSMNVQAIAENDECTVGVMADFAMKHHVALGFGWVSRSADKVYENHYSIVDDNGKMISDYVKCHPFFSEQGIFSAGEAMPFCRIKDVDISNVICYDLRFPELFRNINPKAHIILVPAEWPASRREHWKTLLRARAIENQAYVVGINGVGRIADVDYAGESCIVDPDGNVIFMAPSEEGLFCFDIQDDVEEYRQKLPVLKDRRNKFYADLYSEME